MIPIISIIFAVGLPAVALWQNGKKYLQRPYLFSVGSFAFCAIAAIAELFTIKRRVFAGDIGGIEDTIGAVIAICIGLVVITLILNLLLLGISYEKNSNFPF